MGTIDNRIMLGSYGGFRQGHALEYGSAGATGHSVTSGNNVDSPGDRFKTFGSLAPPVEPPHYPALAVFSW